MVPSLKIGDKCPKCRSPVTRGSKMFFWRGEYQDGAFCMACNSLWPIEGEEIPPLKPRQEVSDDLRQG